MIRYNELIHNEMKLTETEILFMTELKSCLEQATKTETSLNEIEKKVKYLRYSFMVNIIGFRAYLWFIYKDGCDLKISYGKKNPNLIYIISKLNTIQ